MADEPGQPAGAETIMVSPRRPMSIIQLSKIRGAANGRSGDKPRALGVSGYGTGRLNASKSSGKLKHTLPLVYRMGKSALAVYLLFS